MKCEICGDRSAYDFSKTFNEFGLARVDYWRCADCGFVLSKTHAEMSHEAWSEMNRLTHETYQGQEENRLDPRWKTRLAAQARALGELADASLLDAGGRWLDYGCGDGALADLAAGNGLTLLKHDEYMAAGDDYLPKAALKPHAFDFVITTSVFEHLTRRNQWDAIEALVAPAGALGISTLVAERVPSDPAWFYLEPPHCAFFSNAAMARLFDDWGYRASVYSVAASLWVWFRQEPAEIEAKVARLNAQASEPYHFKAGFMDYWKVDPRRREG